MSLFTLVLLLVVVVAVVATVRRGTFSSGTRGPSRTATGASALVLGGLAALFLEVLVANDSDNAYIGLVIIGLLLILAALPFALATLLPHGGFRRVVAGIGLVLLWVLGAGSALILIPSLMIIPSQDYSYDGREFPYHVIASLVLLLAVPGIYLLAIGWAGRLAAGRRNQE